MALRNPSQASMPGLDRDRASLRRLQLGRSLYWDNETR